MEPVGSDCDTMAPWWNISIDQILWTALSLAIFTRDLGFQSTPCKTPGKGLCGGERNDTLIGRDGAIVLEFMGTRETDLLFTPLCEDRTKRMVSSLSYVSG